MRIKPATQVVPQLCLSAAKYYVALHCKHSAVYKIVRFLQEIHPGNVVEQTLHVKLVVVDPSFIWDITKILF